MIKYILSTLLLVIQLQATDIEEDNNNFRISGKVTTYFTDVDIHSTDHTTTNKDMYYLSTQLNLDYTLDNFYFQATPYFYIMDTSNHQKVSNITMNKPYEKSMLFFRSLYISYTVDNWTIGVGILPFSNSVPMKFSDNSIQDGVGLNTLNDNDLTSLFGIYKTSNSETIFGIGSMEELIVPTGEYISDNLKEGTKLYFIINTVEHDKWTFTNELFYVDMKYNNKDLSEIYLYGLGVSWDDTSESGLVVYNVAGASMYKNNSINAKDEIYTVLFSDNPYGLDGITYGNMVAAKYPDSFAINDETYYGGSNLLGFRYEMDYFPLETFINMEWFHTFGDWSSGNQGNMYNGKINQSFNVRDNSYYINFGILTTKNSLLRFSYTYAEYEEFGKIGAPASTVQAEDFLGGKSVRNKVEGIHVIFTYKF